MKSKKVRISIYIDVNILSIFDLKRGQIPRNSLICELISEWVDNQILLNPFRETNIERFSSVG